MFSLPGYDAWLTHDPRDDDQPDCQCGHEQVEHEIDDKHLENDNESCNLCSCDEYRPKDDYYYEELRQEAMLAKWEDR